ncbi:MAG: sodium ion-translocating decarboxylase subunit beta [Candidatus Eisenbacteria bacterium]|nr:sodium ion-translocating decarboxylase subunit beta [Candidatus Eisenbacteria bacterium]
MALALVLPANAAGTAEPGVGATSELNATPDHAPAGQPEAVSLGGSLTSVVRSTGLWDMTAGGNWKFVVMVVVGFVLLYLGVVKGFEPLLLVPIGFGTIFVNVPLGGMGGPHGFMTLIFDYGIRNEVLPLIVFMGIGSLCDFGPLLAYPRVAILGAAAQFGVFGTLLGVAALNALPGLEFSIKQACSIAIIGAADGPTSIIVASKFAPELLGSIAVAAYSYMALVPVIQPPIMKLLTTPAERRIRMRQVREVSRLEKVLFPLMLVALCVLLLPTALPLMGCFAFGNFIKESGAIERLSKTLQNELMNLATIFLGLGVGMQMVADKFLLPSTLGIILLGLLAFTLGTAGGVLFAKLMNLFWKGNPVNPLIGSAGVSAFPMAARVSNRQGLEADPHNFLLMHALGANLAGQIGSVVAAGVILSIFR